RKGRDFVHQGKIEIDVNERAVLSNRKTAFSFTPTPIVSLTICRKRLEVLNLMKIQLLENFEKLFLMEKTMTQMCWIWTILVYGK
ncbi:MAG TPA: hypothetical protein DGH14_06885, partial [Roseburia sp.]|nr:hypothetical protein [Roseburia sp.]